MKSVRILSASLALGVVIGLAAAFVNAAQSHDQVTAQVKQKLALVESKWVKKDAAGLVDSLYVPETEITGEGVPELFTGKDQLNGLITHLMEGAKSTSIKLDKLEMLGEGSAYTWVTWNVLPEGKDEKPFKMKSLFVWKHIDGDWRIVADMFATGEIPSSK